jgi:DNA-binding transcriptional MerR regulator/methylmalonyl-CoA mutase cobalamin-binding subunit
MDYKHPIKVVALRTGLSPHVIRIWERRYKAVTPDRTPTNRRTYSDRDIDRLILLKHATEAGESIGQIAGLSDDELRELVKISVEYPPSAISLNNKSGKTAEYLERCLKAAMDLDSDDLEKILLAASSELTQPVLLEGVLEPLMLKIGDYWREGKLRVVHEHMASAIIRTFLGNMIGAYKPSQSAPILIVTTPSGQNHEFGALMSAITAFSAGWRAVYLGPNIPAEEIANAVQRAKADAVALSIIYPADDPHLATELRKLRNMLGDKIAIFVGGRSKDSYSEILQQIGVIMVENLAELSTRLETIRITTAKARASA